MSKRKRSLLQNYLQKKLGIVFRKPALLESAFQHPSYCHEHGVPPEARLAKGGRPAEDFDRLEFFGDAILNFVVCRKLFEMFPEEYEGMLSRLRSTLVSRKILARIAKSLGFLGWIQLGKSLKKQKEYSKAKLLADAFEAFLASLYLDQGFAKTERFILTHFGPYFNMKRLFRLDPNPKSMLQEISQKRWQRLPLYATAVGPEKIKTVVSVDRRHQATAYGKTRKESEEKAARLLLRKLRQAAGGEPRPGRAGPESWSSPKRTSSGMKFRKTL